MKKKLVACFLVAAMTLGLTACGGTDSPSSNTNGDSTDGPVVTNETEDVEIDGITYHRATDLTDEDIELTFIHFMDTAMVDHLIERFEELYPNIKITPQEGGDDFQATITSLIQTGETPDIIMYTDADTTLYNNWLMDITSLWNSDEETKELPDTITDEEHGMGTFDTGHRFAAPAKYYPGIMFADRNVLEKLNVDVPDQHWTWSEMIDIIKACTKEVSGTKYYGLGYYNRLDSYYGIAAGQQYIGEFGFNGTEFDLSAWAIGEQEFSELKMNGYIAPLQSTQEMEDWLGDWDEWCGRTGQVALFSEAFWTFQNLWNTPEYEQYGLDIVPYVVPAVSEEDANEVHHTIANISFGGIMEGCPYPREAYEFMKFAFFGRDGWLTKIAYYASDATNAAGTALARYSDMLAPITTNEEVWAAYIEMYCDGMDEEHTELWREYFKYCNEPICFGWNNIAGYWNACTQYFNLLEAGGYVGIHDIVDHGAGKAADYKDEVTKKFNYYHADAMINYFGPSGYNILSDEDIQLYEDMIDANS